MSISEAQTIQIDFDRLHRACVGHADRLISSPNLKIAEQLYGFLKQLAASEQKSHTTYVCTTAKFIRNTFPATPLATEAETLRRHVAASGKVEPRAAMAALLEPLQDKTTLAADEAFSLLRALFKLARSIPPLDGCDALKQIVFFVKTSPAGRYAHAGLELEAVKAFRDTISIFPPEHAAYICKPIARIDGIPTYGRAMNAAVLNI